jgi:hypothetical protein
MMSHNDLAIFLANHGYKMDSYGHYKKTFDIPLVRITKDPVTGVETRVPTGKIRHKEVRYRMQSFSVRREFRYIGEPHCDKWMGAETCYFKDLCLTDDNKLKFGSTLQSKV